MLGSRISHKWWVTWTIMVGSFLFALDTTIVNIAIPKIMTSISADLHQIQWVLIIYMIGMAVVMPAAGWLSDLFVCAAMGHSWDTSALTSRSCLPHHGRHDHGDHRKTHQ